MRKNCENSKYERNHRQNTLVLRYHLNSRSPDFLVILMKIIMYFEKTASFSNEGPTNAQHRLTQKLIRCRYFGGSCAIPVL